jgi:PAT family beta-lactamase induction signal transducer AmpG
MALADSRWQRIVAFCALYLAQGVPWGFMLITLPSYLAYHHAVGDDEIGKLKAIILVPWSFKLIWAPLMDSFTIRSMGRRRVWIIGAEVMMAVTLLGFIGLSNPAGHLRFLLYMYFLHNCFASLQDVCTDALAVDILSPSEQGQMNGMMWGLNSSERGLARGAWHTCSLGGESKHVLLCRSDCCLPYWSFP